MPGFAADYVDPKRAFELRAQEYERIIERINGKLAEAERGYGKGLVAVREAHAFVSAIIRDSSAEASEWKSDTLKRANPLLGYLASALQDLEQSR